MSKNLLLEYSEKLAAKCKLLCKGILRNANTVFQFRKRTFRGAFFVGGARPKVLAATPTGSSLYPRRFPTGSEE